MKREEEQRNRDRELQQQQQQQQSRVVAEPKPEKVKEVKVVREEQRVAVEKPLSRREDKKEAEVEVVVVK